MLNKKFERLIKRGLLTETELSEGLRESLASGKYPEDWLIEKGVPKYEYGFRLRIMEISIRLSSARVAQDECRVVVQRMRIYLHIVQRVTEHIPLFVRQNFRGYI